MLDNLSEVGTPISPESRLKDQSKYCRQDLHYFHYFLALIIGIKACAANK